MAPFFVSNVSRFLALFRIFDHKNIIKLNKILWVIFIQYVVKMQ